MSYLSNYDKTPYVQVSADPHDCMAGWAEISGILNNSIPSVDKPYVIAVECYTGIYYLDLLQQIRKCFDGFEVIDIASVLLPPETITERTRQYITDDPVFGIMNELQIEDFQNIEQVEKLRNRVKEAKKPIVLFGHGASTISSTDLLIYADMARWEIQMRMRKNQVDSLGLKDRDERIAVLYKRGYFVDWRVCDRLKMRLFGDVDFFLDTNNKDEPKLITGISLRNGLRLTASKPHRVVPFFDPGPWGGQWMKEVCDLDREKINFAWCFDCVPEENSLLLKFGDRLFETPSINTVLFQSENLLGRHIVSEFGKEFPIRFDFLDTMDGGNLSLQVHPTKEYIREQFNMPYTQDESYYLLDSGADAHVYLGLQDGVIPTEMIAALNKAQEGETPFPAEKYVNIFPVNKHDHVLIPSGTIHCSGRNSMVLEISATPYIFTFKLWDWGRLGLDGRPRPIHINHGQHVIQWDRTTDWSRSELVNVFESVDSGDGWHEERTGLHKLEFIETRRHWFTKSVHHNTDGTVNVLNLVEGREAIVESPSDAFDPFIVHYAETFIVPAAVGEYTIRPYGEAEGSQCATIKAFIRNPLYS